MKKSIVEKYLETSGTAILAYSMLKAVHLGFLPESYREPAIKAFNAIINKYLTTNVKGNVTAGANVECADVGGGIKAEGYVECGDVGGCVYNN